MTADPEYLEHAIDTPTSGRVLVRRARHGSPAGVLTGFHGYAEAAEAQMQRLAGIPGLDQWILVSIQALNRFYRGRTQETVASWMTRQDRELAIAANITYVDRALRWIRTHYVEGIGTPRGARAAIPLVHVGFSQGSAMAFRAGVGSEWRADGIIAVGADVPPDVLGDPGVSFPPVLLARGERDEWYTRKTFEADVSALTARQVSVTPAVYDGGHEWTQAVASLAAEFIRKAASGREPSR